MQLRRNISQMFEAIPDRIEVSGHEPTWQVTGGSFDSAVSYAKDAFGDPVVIARQDRRRWWPRVTLTVTKDPELAAEAPPIEALADPEPTAATFVEHPSEDAAAPDEPEPESGPEFGSESESEEMFEFLEGVFNRQDHRVPEQRDGSEQ